MKICKSWIGRIFGKRSKKSIRQFAIKNNHIVHKDAIGQYTRWTFIDCNKFGTRKTKMQITRSVNIGQRFYRV